MNLRTRIETPASEVTITHDTEMLLFGSCFSEEIGNKLAEHKFRVEINPFGILYNPSSVYRGIERLITGKPFTSEELICHHGMYHSLMHHGSFSSPRQDEVLRLINERFEKAVSVLPQCDLLLITFGTAWVFRHLENGIIVANCHKLPARQFDRFRLTVEQITREWEGLIARLLRLNPQIRLLFTVSPVRHWKDGAHENQLSKSILHLAIDHLEQRFPQQVAYFPSYELMMDELRDYRFYGDDMLHPSPLAVDYIWERFSKACFSDETRRVNSEWSAIRKALDHRPLHPDSEAYRHFRRQTTENLDAFMKRYPGIPCEDERKQLNL
jgi:hypothetical protein